MIVLLVLLAAQVPVPAETRLAAASTDLSVAVLEPDASRVRLTNDGKIRLRILQPYFEADGPTDGFKGCVLWNEGPKPHPVSAPTDGRKRYVLLRDADFTLAPGEAVELSLRCDARGPEALRLIHAMVGRAGVEQPFWVISRTAPPPAVAAATP